jgi:prevent-host-death family protein
VSALDIVTETRLNVIMTEVLGVAETKRRFAELLDRVRDGERVIVTRRGRPVAALVPTTDEAAAGEEPTYLGLAAFAGALADWPEFEETMAEVIASRASAGQRPAPEFE